MATEYNITQKQYNGTDYDTLYPKTTSQQVLLNDGAISYTGDATVNGALTKQQAEIDSLNSKFSAIIGYKTVDVGSVTILADGYLNLNSYRPATPTGYQFMFALVNAWSSTTSKTAFNITDNGTWLIGTGGDTITGLQIDYFYIKVGCLGTLI